MAPSISNHQPTYLRALLLSFATSLILAPLGVWAGRQGLGPGSVPLLDPEGRAYWLVGFFVTMLVGVLFQLASRDATYALSTATERQIRYEPVSELPTAWIFPAVTTLTVIMLVEVYHEWIAIAICAIGAFLLLSLGTIARHHLFDAVVAARQRARGAYTVLVHVVAFLALSMVYINKVRSLFSATGVLIITVLLLLELTEGEDAFFARRLVYALVGGVMLGQVTWALNYWKAAGWTGGAPLLVTFYLAAGLIAAQLRGGAAPRDLLEYGGVGALAMGIVVYSLLA